MQTWIPKPLATVAGHISIVLGVVGIVLPVLPTTPFLLLAAYFYSQGSPRAHQWLLNHRFFGPYIQSWQKDRSLPLKAKIQATSLMTLTLGSSIVFFVKPVALKAALASVGIAVAIYLWRLPTRR